MSDEGAGGANETEACNQCREDADAAIAVVLEEAAKVADAEASIEGIAQHIAAAIRGLITSPESAAPDADQSPATR
jgi:hypothetical protein